MSEVEATTVPVEESEAMPEAQPEATEETPAAEETPVEEEETPVEEEEISLDLDALPKMKVSEIKDILKALDLPTSGIKTVLIERIQEHFAEQDKEEEAAAQAAAEEDTPDETENGTAKKEDAAAEDPEEELLLKENSEPTPDFISIKKPADKTETKPENTLTDEERKKNRSVKFGGVETDDEKKETRAAKFGIDTEKAVEAKKEARNAKFSSASPTTETADAKKAARAARFGIGAAANKLSVSTEDKAKDSDVLKKRAARFNLDSEPAAKTAKKIKYDSAAETKTAETKTAEIKTVILSDVTESLKEKIETGATKVTLSAATLSLAEKKKARALKFGA